MKNIFLFIATLLAFFVKAITGFGNTLVLDSLFSFVVPNRLTTPVDLIFSIPTNIFMVWKERKNISPKVVVPLSLMLLTGIIPGTLILRAGSDWILKSILGIVIIGLGIEMLIRKSVKNINKKGNIIFFMVIGVISGVLAGLYGIGALLVAYIGRTSENKGQFRGNICCIFLIDNVFRLFLYLYTGIINKEILILIIFLSPAVFIGMIIGMKIDSKIKEDTMKKVVISLLIMSGAILILKNFSIIRLIV